MRWAPNELWSECEGTASEDEDSEGLYNPHANHILTVRTEIKSNHTFLTHAHLHLTASAGAASSLSWKLNSEVFLCTPDKSDYWGEPTKRSRLQTGQSSVVVWELGRATGQLTSFTQVYFYLQVYFSERKKKKREVFLLALHIKKKNIINLGSFPIRSAKSIYSVGACVFKGERKYAVVWYYLVY